MSSLYVAIRCELYIGGNSVPTDADIDLQRCGAYEVVKFSKQKVVMNDNPAYGEIGR